MNLRGFICFVVLFHESPGKNLGEFHRPQSVDGSYPTYKASPKLTRESQRPQSVGLRAEHDGYDLRILPPVFRFRTPAPAVLSVAHASFDLKHHLVLATTFRRGIFDSKLGEAVVNYWSRVAQRREFALDQATVLPDHVHMLVRITPKTSIEQCALSLMNNGQHFVGKHFPERLIEAGINQLWQAFAYAGSCGELPTALLKSFLRGDD